MKPKRFIWIRLRYHESAPYLRELYRVIFAADIWEKAAAAIGEMVRIANVGIVADSTLEEQYLAAAREVGIEKPEPEEGKARGRLWALIHG